MFVIDPSAGLVRQKPAFKAVFVAKDLMMLVKTVGGLVVQNW